MWKGLLMACYDCSRYPLCINYPDGTWKTVYDEAQEEIAKTYKSAKDINADMDKIIQKASDLVSKGIADKLKADEEKHDQKFIDVQRKEKPMDAPMKTAFNQIKKAPCKNC